MITGNCKKCGGDYGIHHFETNQCPVGGVEAPIGRKQEWKTTTFEPESNELDDLRDMVKKLTDRVDELMEKIDQLQAGSELEESVRIYSAE